jgi:two-component system sensor histidine kinase/response regulator
MTAVADILVVDDAPANLQVISGLLKGHGYRVRLSPSGRLALHAARQEPPDLILLDVNMPELSGYEVAEELKKDPALRDIPIIFLSALQDTVDKVRAFAAGAVDYVTKPFQFEEVEARVRTHLSLRRLQAELEQRRQSLEQANHELRKLQELRDNLTHMIVHDLRSPLTAIIANLDLVAMREKSLSPVGADSLADARASSLTLVRMVSSMLDVSRMEAGQLELARTACELGALCQEAVRSVRVPGTDVECLVDAPEPLVVAADKELLVRVLENLLGNAFKYAPPGDVVRVGVARAASALRVTVADHGPGIAPEQHARIFEKFGQAQPGGPRSGSGLGLTFCKLAVEAHGGRIGVESQLGKGATFWFELPA